jgi:putative hemolysin
MPTIDVVQRGYRLRFARTEEDLEAVGRLRFEIFNLELGEGLDASFEHGIDRDPFDDQCQHLMVIEEASQRVVGTYRLQVAESAMSGAGFYSETEFDLSTLPREVRSNAIELGRACVARAHRSKSVLFLLWRGLAAYVLWNKRRYFFGCSSLTSQDTDLGLATYDWLRARGHVHPTIAVTPHPGRGCEASGRTLGDIKVEIPTLFGIYLRYGALALGPPAIDREFGTIDFLTLLDVDVVDPKTFQSFAG